MPQKMDNVDKIVAEAKKQVDRVLNNNIKRESCPEKKQKAAWIREKVVKELIVQLGGVGPSEVK